jgi:MFS family permease
MFPTASPAKLSPFAVFRNRSFALLWVGQLISMIGSGMTTIAASILVYRVTGAALSVGLMLIAAALPSLAVGLLAGVFVDRWNRKWIMIAADLIRAALIAAIPLLLQFGIAWLYVIVMLATAAGQFFEPARASVVPELASDEELAAANAMMTVSDTGATMIGWAAAGLIATRLPIAWVFELDALSFLLSALCIVPIRLAPLCAAGAASVTGVLQDLRAGLRFLAGAPKLRGLFLVFVPVFLLFGFQNSLWLPFAVRALHASDFQYGLLEGVPMFGFVLGSLVMAHVAGHLREGLWIALSFLGMALGNIIFSQVSSVALAIAAGLLINVMNAPSYIGRQLLIQRNTARDMRGRVNSAFFVARDTALVLGMAMAGLADLYDVRILYFGSALLLLAVAVVALIVLGLGRPADAWTRIAGLKRQG